jgi:hypothetical protein
MIMYEEVQCTQPHSEDTRNHVWYKRLWSGEVKGIERKRKGTESREEEKGEMNTASHNTK